MPDPYRELPEDKSEATPVVKPTLASSVEEEILALERELAVKKATLQKEKPRPLEQAIGMETPKPTNVATTAASAAVAAALSPQVVRSDAKNIKKLEKNQQLKSLVDLAFVKGVSHAVEVVRNLDSPYLMDEFHDTLVDHLHKELVDKGKLEEI